MMDVHATVDTTTYTMGDQFSTASNPLPINYNFAASTGNQIANVNVFINGIIVKSMPVASASVTG